jgi:hypothetical protein
MLWHLDRQTRLTCNQYRGGLVTGAAWQLRRAHWRVKSLCLHWLWRALAARYGHRDSNQANAAHEENDVADILIFSLSGLALTLFAVERIPCFVVAIAASP